MEISTGFPAEPCQMHESPGQEENVNQAMHKLLLSKVLPTAVLQSLNLGPRPSPGTMLLSVRFSFITFCLECIKTVILSEITSYIIF